MPFIPDGVAEMVAAPQQGSHIAIDLLNPHYADINQIRG